MEPTVISKARRRDRLFRHPLLRRYFSLVHEDLTAIYSRDMQKWLLVAPLIGVVTGLGDYGDRDHHPG